MQHSGNEKGKKGEKKKKNVMTILFLPDFSCFTLSMQLSNIAIGKQTNKKRPQTHATTQQ